jgi:hypothetical protein
VRRQLVVVSRGNGVGEAAVRAARLDPGVSAAVPVAPRLVRASGGAPKNQSSLAAGVRRRVRVTAGEVVRQPAQPSTTRPPCCARLATRKQSVRNLPSRYLSVERRL